MRTLVVIDYDRTLFDTAAFEIHFAGPRTLSASTGAPGAEISLRSTINDMTPEYLNTV
jgi:hypothetical protein